MSMNRLFRLKENGTTVMTEVIAGLTTFFAMAYIVVTNPNQVVGFTFGGAFDTIWNSVYVASIIVAVLGTLLYAFYAKLPYAQAASDRARSTVPSDKSIFLRGWS